MKHVLSVLAFTIVACGRVEAPTAEHGAELEAHAAKLIECRKQGREAGAYAAYEACKKDAGVE